MQIHNYGTVYVRLFKTLYANLKKMSLTLI